MSYIKNNIEFKIISEEWYASLDPSTTESTKVKYRNCLNLHINPEFGEKKIKDIDYPLVSDWCNNLLQSGENNGKGMASKTVFDNLVILKSILKFAMRFKYEIDPSALEVSVRQKEKNFRVFTSTEELLIKGYLKEHMNMCNLGILICMYTGMRVGEICALRWEDISLANKTIYVNKTLLRLQTQNGTNKTKVIITDPKSQYSIRYIPIASPLLPYLEEYKQGMGYILTGDSEKFKETRVVQARFKTILKKCNIKDASFHTIRHTFATRCVELGFDIKVLSEILGHATVNITLNRYVHPSMDAKHKCMELFDN